MTLTLAVRLPHEVAWYAATSDTATFYPILDDTHHVYAVVVVEEDPR